MVISRAVLKKIQQKVKSFPDVTVFHCHKASQRNKPPDFSFRNSQDFMIQGLWLMGHRDFTVIGLILLKCSPSKVVTW